MYKIFWDLLVYLLAGFQFPTGLTLFLAYYELAAVEIEILLLVSCQQSSQVNGSTLQLFCMCCSV